MVDEIKTGVKYGTEKEGQEIERVKIEVRKDSYKKIVGVYISKDRSRFNKTCKDRKQ